MQVIRKSGCLNDIFQESYKNFSKKCMKGDESALSIRDDFYFVKDLYVKKGLVQDFFEKTVDLSEKVEKEGHVNISDLLINELSKLCTAFSIRGNVEKIYQKAIANCRRNHDGFHELARINDLLTLYEYTNRRNDLLKVLHKKKNCCKRILTNYDENVKNFRTIIKTPATKEQVMSQLGFAYSQMADILSYSRPADAVALYQKSIDVNRELKHYRSADYAAYRIKAIQKGRNYGEH